MVCGVSLLGVLKRRALHRIVEVCLVPRHSYGIPNSKGSSVVLYSPGAYCSLYGACSDSMFHVHMDIPNKRGTMFLLSIVMWYVEDEVHGMPHSESLETSLIIVRLI